MRTRFVSNQLLISFARFLKSTKKFYLEGNHIRSFIFMYFCILFQFQSNLDILFRIFEFFFFEKF